MRTSIILLIVLMLPFFLGFTDISYGSVVTESNQHFRITTPNVIITDDQDVMIMNDQDKTDNLELPKTPKSPPSILSQRYLRRTSTSVFLMDDNGKTEINENIEVAEYIVIPEIPLSPPFLKIDFRLENIMKHNQTTFYLMY